MGQRCAPFRQAGQGRCAADPNRRTAPKRMSPKLRIRNPNPIPMASLPTAATTAAMEGTLRLPAGLVEAGLGGCLFGVLLALSYAPSDLFVFKEDTDSEFTVMIGPVFADSFIGWRDTALLLR